MTPTNKKVTYIGCSGISLSTVICLILMILKILDVIDWSWWVIFIPLVLPYVAALVFMLLFWAILSLVVKSYYLKRWKRF